MMSKIEIDSLHPIYLEIYNALNNDEDALLEFFKTMSGQQINLPVHLYDPSLVKKKLNDLSKIETVDVELASMKYGFSRRWIRLAIQNRKRR